MEENWIGRWRYDSARKRLELDDVRPMTEEEQRLLKKEKAAGLAEPTAESDSIELKAL